MLVRVFLLVTTLVLPVVLGVLGGRNFDSYWVATIFTAVSLIVLSNVAQVVSPAVEVDE